MNEITQTVFNSLQDLFGRSVQVIPAILIALIIILLTRYAAQFMQNVAGQIGKGTLRSQSLQLLLSKTAYVFTWVIGVTLACVIGFPGLRLGDIITTLGLGSVAVGLGARHL